MSTPTHTGAHWDFADLVESMPPEMRALLRVVLGPRIEPGNKLRGVAHAQRFEFNGFRITVPEFMIEAGEPFPHQDEKPDPTLPVIFTQLVLFDYGESPGNRKGEWRAWVDGQDVYSIGTTEYEAIGALILRRKIRDVRSLPAHLVDMKGGAV